ncbi:MarR family transcriptional regulator [Phytomonospora sp. NPDC050363]|uniref:MarR family winged helix-turn-helix transcriptional regulator n=1 Tax=Phytomonospora sp. NPDC050363 TaxID=3155642 RepID=UPI0033F7CAFB
MTDETPAVLAGEVNGLMRDMVLMLRRVGAEQPVTAPQLSVLGSLLTGPRRMSDLAEEHGVRMPTMTVQVNRLERDGLAVRGRDGSDARVVTVALTDEGREALSAGRAHRIDYLAERLARLSPHDRAAIAAAVPALSRMIKGAPTDE